MHRLATIVVAAAALFAGPNLASASTITFGILDFATSSVTTSGVNLSGTTTGVPALPADNTFTLPASGLGSLAVDEGKFVRYVFSLPSGFSNLAFEFSVGVNDEFALYLNDTIIATQTDTSTANFVVPLPGVNLTALGVATDTSGGNLNFLIAGSTLQSLFQVGTNELTIFGTDTLGGGGFSAGREGSENGPFLPLDTTILGTVSFVPVPEPGTALLLATGLATLAVRRRRLKSDS